MLINHARRRERCWSQPRRRSRLLGCSDVPHGPPDTQGRRNVVIPGSLRLRFTHMPSPLSHGAHIRYRRQGLLSPRLVQATVSMCQPVEPSGVTSTASRSFSGLRSVLLRPAPAREYAGSTGAASSPTPGPAARTASCTSYGRPRPPDCPGAPSKPTRKPLQPTHRSVALADKLPPHAT